MEFGTLIDIIYKYGLTKQLKSINNSKDSKKENLQDNMANNEWVLNMFAEPSIKEILESTSPETFSDHINIAKHKGIISLKKLT